MQKKYKNLRETNELWKKCEGKEVMKVIAKALGLNDHQSLEYAVVAYWNADQSRVPRDVLELRKQLEEI